MKQYKQFRATASQRSAGLKFEVRLSIPPKVLAEQERGLLAPRSLTATLMGDPPIWRSALARKCPQNVGEGEI